MKFNELSKKEEKFLISIVTINRNNAINLKKTLASLKAVESDCEVELIFIDGASSDDSVALARRLYKTENLVSEPDAGIYNAMNKGLYMARGKYVLWLNSGDEFINDDLDKVKTTLKESTTDLISFGLKFLDGEANSLKFVWLPKKNNLPTQTLPHPSTFFKRDCFIRLGGYSETFKIAGDREAFLRMYFAGCTIDVHTQIIAKFYDGGISSTIKCSIENLSIDKCYGLISLFDYCYRFSRIYFKILKKKYINF